MSFAARPITIGLALLVCATLFPSQRTKASDIIEFPVVLDGGTLLIRTVIIKLDGIDALELGQKCIGAGNIEWDCGLHAKRALAERIGDGPVSCRQLQIGAYGRPSATCAASNGEDLSAALVRSGYALACGPRYMEEEKAAHLAGTGMWSGSFQTPWEWRAQQPDPPATCDDINCFHLSRVAACR
jgi:endonuclease YncB( thermonuclease family)